MQPLRVRTGSADVGYCDRMAVADRLDTDTETLTILYEEAEDGWIAARIEEVPAAISQGRTREEARANVISALHDLTNEATLAERALYRLRSLFAHR
jgi:predicted RNase H-like HicB family nuclease